MRSERIVDSRIHMDRRYACPECDCAAIIRHRLAQVKALEYECPDCRTRFVDTTPVTPPNPTLPPGVELEAPEWWQQVRGAA